MRKPKMKRKLFSILLCFAMLMSLMPISASAYTHGYAPSNYGEEIQEIEIEVVEPVAGQTPSSTYELGTGGYHLTNIRWAKSGSGNYMDWNDTFEAGAAYIVYLTVEPNSGYAITRQQGDSHWYYEAEAYVNGKRCDFEKSPYDTTPKGEIMIERVFNVPNAEIDTIEIKNVVAPIPGQYPAFTAKTATTGTKLTDGNYDNAQNGVYWYDNCCREDMGANDVFVSGHQYRLIVHLEALKGYEFADNIFDAYVNGKGADWDNETKESMDVVYYFNCKNEVVTSVAVEDIKAPSAGSVPDYKGTIYDPAVDFKKVNNTFTQNGISWFNVTDNWSMTPNDRFEAGKQYSVTITLMPSDSIYEFNVSKGYLNGKEGTVTRNGKEVTLEYVFSAIEQEVISKVEVNNVSVPKAGASPSYIATVRGGAEFKDVKDANFKNGMAWFDKTTGKYVPVNGKFETGHEYLVEAYLVPGDGYVFDGNAKATVNGQKANVVTASKNEFYITYAFESVGEAVPAEITVLDQASVVKITAPKAGEAPNYDAMPANEAYDLKNENDRNTKNGITWKNETTGKLMLAGIDKFEAGNVYSVTVGLDTAENAAFLTDSDAELNIDGFINGKKATVSGRNETEAYLTLTFEKLPLEEAPVVPEEPVTPETPVTPQKQSNFTDVKADAYYATPVAWAVANGITSGTSATEFSPNMTCSQAHILTFLWRSVGKPASNMSSPYSNPNVTESKYYYTPFVWAWEKGLVGNVKHDPNAPCSRADVVTYLWKLEGKPDAPKSAFTDVSATADYAKAVDWAVANGITSGTSKTTFGPAETCTRGQIVTFLWRYVNGK